MSIKNNKNNKNICLVLYIYIYMEIWKTKITLLYSVLYISRYKEYCSVLWNNIHLYILYIHCNKTKVIMCYIL